jgi:hypothetical protein
MKYLILSISLLMHSILLSGQQNYVEQAERNEENGVSEIHLKTDDSLYIGMVFSRYDDRISFKKKQPF